tara:strand:- start:2494 stop:4113 length:1620 start_codon:yes stop_codon:yes gene_type:complete
MGLLDQQSYAGYADEGQRLAVEPMSFTPMDAAKFIAEATPIIGDAMAAKEIYDEIQKPEPNYGLVAVLAGASLIGLVPLIGDAAAAPIKKVARGLLDVVDRVEVDPNALGSTFGNLKLKPKPDVGEPYKMSGEKIADELQDIPTAFNFLNPDQALPVGSKYTNIKSQQPNALRQHTSEGFMSADTIEPEVGSISDLYGKNVMAIVGDPTDRKTVTHFNGNRLLEPVRSQAGFRYSDVDGQAYAGDITATNSKINEAMKHDNPYFMSTLMGEVSGDFAQHQGDMYGQMWKQKQSGNNAIIGENAKKINNHIKNMGVPKIIPVRDINGNILKKADGSNVTKSVTTRPFKDINIDIEDPDAIYNAINSLPTGSQRSYFLKGMDKKGLLDMGAPSVSDARLAVADVNQIGMDWGTVGYRGFTPDLEKGVFPTTIENSTTYNTGYDKIGNAQTFLQGSRGIPANLIYRDTGALLRKKGTGGGLLMTSPNYKVLESSPKKAIQLIDDEIAEVGDTFLEIERTKGRREALEYANKIISGGYGLLSR